MPSISAESSELPSRTSLIFCIVISSERRRVLGDVAVVPSEARRPWPAAEEMRRASVADRVTEDA